VLGFGHSTWRVLWGAMQRREFIAVLAGVAATLPLLARAQSDRMRRVGVLMGYAEDDPEAQFRLAALKQELAALGWSEGRNLAIDVRWIAGDTARATVFAKQLVVLQPDVIVANTTPATDALFRETTTTPIVFNVVSEPIGSGFVQSLSRPGGNITGFVNLEGSLVEKWLEMLKELAPETMRVAVMFNPQTAPYAEYYLRPLHAAAPRVGVSAYSVAVSSDTDIENSIAGLGRERGSGLILMTDSFMTVHRHAVIEQAARHKVPCFYFVSNAATEGGLISYGVDLVDLFRRTGQYVDRVLRGAKPSDLPVQLPTKFELVINVKTANALGLNVPTAILLRADKVIE
jgi:putative ABC transport system substrate-binding protein